MSLLFQFPLRSTSDNPRTGPLRRQMSSFVVPFESLGGAGPLSQVSGARIWEVNEGLPQAGRRAAVYSMGE